MINKIQQILFIISLSFTCLIMSCKKSNDAPCNISASETGPLFNKVDSLITSSCAGSNCHTQGGDEGGYSFDTKCKIVDNWNAINSACVIRGNMPPSGFITTQNQSLPIG